MTNVETMMMLRDKVDTEVAVIEVDECAETPKNKTNPNLVAWRVAARGMAPEYWARSIRQIKYRLTRHRVACLVWWDYFGVRQTAHRWAHLDKLTSGFPTVDPVRAAVVDDARNILKLRRESCSMRLMKALAHPRYVFKKSPFIIGMGSVLALDGRYFSSSRTKPHSRSNPDAEAIRSDWAAVGGDFRTVMSEYSTRKAQ